MLEFGQTAKPFNVRVMDVDDTITSWGVRKVTALSIHEASSLNFHPEGLFSEEIFGTIGSTQRMETFGYIELNTPIITPIIYRNLVRLSAFYEELMAGKVYATFNPVTKNFDRVFGDPEEIEGAGTGYTFFLSHFDELEYPTTSSTERETRIEILKKFSERSIIRRCLVLPAGLRDIRMDEGRTSQDDINKLYTSLMQYSFALPPGNKNPLYDGVRMNIQRKVVEIYDYIKNLFEGKKGFLQGRYGKRQIALGTRNVITAGIYDTLTPDAPQALRHDETMIGLFQCMKGLQPAIIHLLKTAFIQPILGDGDTARIALTNPNTLKLEYVQIPQKELNKYNTSAALEGWINRFKNADVRAKPLSILDSKGVSYYLSMIYDTGDEISLFRSINDLETALGKPANKAFIRPLTWLEVFYLITWKAAQDRHVFITRYPVIEDGSSYPTKVHVVTTAPSRVMGIRDLLSDTLSGTCPEFPTLGGSYNDSITIHTSSIKGLGADYDGDTVSANFVLSDEANAEVGGYLHSIQAYVNAQKTFIRGGATDLVGFMLLNMTK